MKKFLTSIVLVVSLVVFAIPALAGGTVYPSSRFWHGCCQYTSKCGEVITGTGAAPTPEAAWSKAEQIAQKYLNQHVSSCSKCQQK